ncbi:MAG: SprT family zinc-dependent metalloprotease [Chloroflexota bacterium]
MTALPSYQTPYVIRRSTRARRSRLTVTEDGHAVVILPLRAPEIEAAELVLRHRRWIARHVARMHNRNAALAARPSLDTGRQILFQGVRQRVVVTTSLVRARSTVEIVAGESLLVMRSAREPRSTADILEAWFRARAREAVGERVAARADEMGLTPRQLTIRDQRTRWGSASHRGTLSFSWRLMMCAPWVLDYVVVHELAHLKVSGHSRAFWRVVDRHFADSRGARRWLREHHDEIRHALN